MQEERRQIAVLLEDISRQQGYKFKSFSDEWIFQITDKRGVDCYIWGYKFPNNASASCHICDDKSALSSVLCEKKIPNVEHIYFENAKSSMVDDNGNWNKIIGLFEKYGILVLKANSGSCGLNVYKCSTLKELETAYYNIFQKNRAMAVCPYVEIKNEYRVIMLDGLPQIIYLKERPYVVGDGVNDVKQLAELKFGGEVVPIDGDIDTSVVLPKNKKLIIEWKHNLAHGSMPIILKEKTMKEKLEILAKRAAKALNLNFASIDIVECEDGELKILEANSGVMLEKFSKLSLENYEIAKSIYCSALSAYFDKIDKNIIK